MVTVTRTAQPGMTLTDAGKQYSQASIKTLQKLDILDQKFDGINERIKKASSLSLQSEKADIFSSDDDILRIIKVKNDLAQIAGDLEKLQCRDLDAIETTELTSGKDEARSRRKLLNTAVDNLIHRTQELYKDYADTVKKLQDETLVTAVVTKTDSASMSPMSPTSPMSVANGSSPTKMDIEKISAKTEDTPPIVFPSDERISNISNMPTTSSPDPDGRNIDGAMHECTSNKHPAYPEPIHQIPVVEQEYPRPNIDGFRDGYMEESPYYSYYPSTSGPRRTKRRTVPQRYHQRQQVQPGNRNVFGFHPGFFF